MGGRKPSSGARRSPAKGFDLRRLRCNPKADVGSALRSPCEEEKKQRHSRGEMRSEHNRGASLAAFLLAVSTITLLMVSPVEGQGGNTCVVTAFPGEPDACQGDLLFCKGFFETFGTCEECSPVGQLSECEVQFASNGPDTVANCQRSCFDFYACTTNADCTTTLPFCNVPEGATEGECGECVVTAFPGESGSCPVTDDQGDILLCSSGRCETCESVLNQADCETAFAGDADQIANCQRDCFDFYACTTNADCPTKEPFCNVPDGETEGVCGECVVSALPGAAGSCPDIPVGQTGEGPQLCGRATDTPAAVPICVGCAASAQEDGITSAADCETVLAAPPFNQEADVVANCQRECFDFYACTTNADCPDTLPFCTNGQCGECVVG